MKKSNVMREAITHPIVKNKIDTVNKTDKSQASKTVKDISFRNESDKSRLLDKSRSTQRTES